MFHKDTLRLIKKTIRRFLTIFLMVFIGVAFMVGLLSSHSIMKKSVDIYFDEYNFMDVQLYSSYGFGEEDVKVIKKAKEVKDVFATKFVDVYGKLNEYTYVTRVQELDTNVNQYALLTGRMPQAKNEALTLGSTSFGEIYKVGDKVTVYLEEDSIEDSLNCVEYTIVGTVRTGQYMANTKEASNLNNLTLETVLFVDNSNFVADYYTSMYITLEGAKDLVAFSDEYNEFVSEKLESLQEIIDEQQEYRKNEIVEEIEQEIEDGERELEEEAEKAYKEIADAEKKLAEGYEELLLGEVQIRLAEQEIENGKKEIEKNQKKLDDAKEEVADAKKKVEEESGSSFEEVSEEIEALYMIYVGVEAIVDRVGDGTTVNEQIDNNRQEISELEVQQAEYQRELNNLRLNGGSEEEIEALQTKIDDLEEEINTLESENTFLQTVLRMNENGTFETILNNLDDMAGGSVKETYDGISQIKEADEQITSGLEQIDQAKKDIASGENEIAKAKKELKDGRNTYEEGVEELEDGKLELEEKLEDARIEINKARQELEDLPSAEWMVLDRDMHYSTAMYAGSAKQMKTIGSVVPLLFFLVAALVCMTTMMRLVDEERSQIGVFSALGFSKGQIISKYVIYAFFASILGSVFGVFAGIPIFPNVIYWAWKLMYDTPDVYLYLPLSAAVIGTLSFTVLMMLVTFFVVRKSLNQMPSQLMRPKAPKSTKKVFLEMMPFIWNRLNFTSKVTARNLIRYKSRFFMTVIGVAGCTSLLVLGFGIKDSIAANIDIQYSKILLHDHVVKVDDYKLTDSVIEVINDEIDCDVVAPYMNYSSKVYLDGEEKTISVYVMDRKEDEMVNLVNRITKEKLSIKNGVVISEKFAKSNNLKVGDSIKIESSNGIKQSVEITGICEMYFQHFLFMSDDYYKDTFDETARFDYIAVQPYDSEELFDALEGVSGVESITDFSSAKNTFTTMIEALDLIVIVILLASGSLAFVVLMNLSEVNISERMREIATLKVLGFNDKEVNSYIFKEIFLLALIGAVAGMPLGKIELVYVMNIIDMEMVMFGTAIKPLSYAYGFIITIVFALIVLFFMRGSLKKVEMVESLKSVE